MPIHLRAVCGSVKLLFRTQTRIQTFPNESITDLFNRGVERNAAPTSPQHRGPAGEARRDADRLRSGLPRDLEVIGGGEPFRRPRAGQQRMAAAKQTHEGSRSSGVGSVTSPKAEGFTKASPKRSRSKASC